jgi:3-(3-hydroxy-phenyl)propionate hydroxylase
LQPENIVERLRPFRGDRRTHIVRKTVYTFHARVAERWKVRSVLLAGDAAHLTPPYAGQGMNSGVRDAHNLGWKLAAIIHNRLPAGVLESYEKERRNHAWALIRLALNLGIVMAPSSRVSAWFWQSFLAMTAHVPPLRDYFLEMKFKPKPRFSHGLLGPRDRLGKYSVRGRMMPQPLVRSAAGVQRLDELIGNRFALIYCASFSGPTPPRIVSPLWKWLETVMIWLQPSEEASLTVTASHSGWTLAITAHGAPDQLLVRHLERIIVLRPDRYGAGSFGVTEEHAFADAFAQVLGLHAEGESASHIYKPIDGNQGTST